MDVIYILAVEGVGKYRFTSVNPAFQTATGLDPAQVVGKRVDEVIPEPALSLVLEKYAEAIREKRFVRWEETSDYPTGRLTGVVTIAPAFDEAGHCTHLVGTVHDVTERNRMEQEVRERNAGLEQAVEENEKFSALVENSLDFIAMAALDGTVLYVNPAGRRMVGLGSLEEACSKPLSDYLTPEGLKASVEIEQPAVIASGHWEGEGSLRHFKTGAAIPVQINSFIVLRPGTHEPLCLATVQRDISERKLAEHTILALNSDLEQRVRQRTAELTERTEQLELANRELAKEVTGRQGAEEAALRAADENQFLYSTALVAAHTESFDDALQQCLDLVCRYVGWPVGHLYVPDADETGDLRPTSVWHLDNARAYGAFRERTERTTFRPGEGLPGRVLVSGEPAWIVDVQQDHSFPRKQAAKEVGLRGAFGFPIKLGEQTVAVLEFFTTEAAPADAAILGVMPLVGTQIGRVLERELTRTTLVKQAEDLKRSNEELESFSYSVSHDLRAPLRAMDGFSQMLMEDYAPHLPDEARRYLQVVRDNAKGMGELVDDLLAFSRLGRQPVRKQAIDLRPIVDEVLIELQSEQDGRAVEIDIAELPECRADPALLKQVFANLLSNALKFTRKCDVASIEVGSEQRDREVVYFVRDNGAGFDMQYADKLFGVFQRLHRAEEYEGTGVGLAIVERIVHRHGGRIWAEAVVDHGATFSFTLAGGEADA